MLRKPSPVAALEFVAGETIADELKPLPLSETTISNVGVLWTIDTLTCSALECLSTFVNASWTASNK